jgi:hypothetical protein
MPLSETTLQSEWQPSAANVHMMKGLLRLGHRRDYFSQRKLL